jgi:hypothetical protein
MAHSTISPDYQVGDLAADGVATLNTVLKRFGSRGTFLKLGEFIWVSRSRPLALASVFSGCFGGPHVDGDSLLRLVLELISAITSEESSVNTPGCSGSPRLDA